MKAGDINKQTCMTTLNRDQLDYIDKLGKDHLFKYGHKLSRSEILSEFVNLLIKLNVDVNTIEIPRGEDFWEGILRAVKK